MQRSSLVTALFTALLAGVLALAQGSAPAAPLVLLTRDARRPVPTTIQSGQELIALDDIASLFQVTVREDALAGGVTLSFKGHTIVASPDQPMASVDGRVVTLPSPIVRSGRRWLVPVEFLSRALGLVYDSRIELRKTSRLLIVGDLRVPRVTVRIEQPGRATRLAIEAAPAAEVTTTQEGGRMVIRFDADAIDPALPETGAGLVEDVRPGDQPASLIVRFRGGAAAPRATTDVGDLRTRMTIDVSPAGTTDAPADPEPAPAPAPSEDPGDPGLPSPFASPRPALQTIVLDPGHGGEDTGVVGPGGIAEKDVTLGVARGVKQLIERRLGIRVILTRDDDRVVRLDERAALANNTKADLFLSLHANAAPVSSVTGTEVFYLALDEEGEEARRIAAAESVSLPVLGGGSRRIDVLRWDMAQVPHIEQSAVLAGMLEEELRVRVPMGADPRQRAPLRVLVGANMPAVLIEMAYLTNPGQARRLAAQEFQAELTQAIYEGVMRFRSHLEGQP